ncbi:hypothetical protein G6514_000018 [Epicoccum nigrum]|nr:hypothetical protein G6514_000018 [Epicoccum nigrum]
MASEIVIGIDFGTTYSGVSWAVNGGNKTIRVVNDWPNPVSTVATSDKVPSKLSFQNWKTKNWGYKVDFKEQSLSWFKLLLDPKNKVGQESDKVLETVKQLAALNKEPEDVAADYLRLIWEYTKEDIRKVRGDDWADIYTTRAVLTVPAIWSPSAKDKTMKIARKAGLPENVSLVSEPEAAALAVLREKTEDGSNLRIGDCFVVCDAGGGTVDLISYKICELNPFQVEECAVGDGGLCGSVYLDQAFEKYIRTIVGESQWKGLRLKSKQKMMHEFEMSVKRSYAGDGQQFSVDLQDVEDNPSVGIDDETITLEPSTLKTIFDHVIGKILRLVEKQIDEVRDRGSDVKAILLVGGFGTNRYMHQQLNVAYKKTGIKVLQTNGGWSSICRVSRTWEIAEGALEKDRRRGTRGEWRADNQMHWMLRKGEKVEEGRILAKTLFQSVQVGFFDTGIQYFSDTLSYCADNSPPLRAEPSVKDLCTVHYGVEKAKLYLESSYKDPTTKEKWRDANFDMYVQLNAATLDFFIEYKDKRVAYTEAKYKEEFS